MDGFLEAHRLAGTEDAFVLEIAQRLRDAGRLEEALSRIETAKTPDWKKHELDDLKIDVLDRLGRHEAAQHVRWEVFTETLSPSHLQEFLRKLPPDQVEEARRHAVEMALSHADTHAALSLLVKIGERDAAEQVVLTRLAMLDGQLYFVLRPAAEALASTHPLAAVLLYRQMVDAVLAKAQSKYYDHAVRDFQQASRLAETITDWRGQEPHAAYLTRLRDQHGRKRSFWEKVEGRHR